MSSSSSLLPGRASADATLAQLVLANVPSSARRSVPIKGWSVAAFGMGTYRVHLQVPAHATALRHALRSGINLIDTASNYGEGGSERLIGQVLGELVLKGEFSREGVVVVTKGGYIQGETLVQSQQRERLGHLWPDVVRVSNDCWYCLHPDFLRDQIERSRQRLGLAHIDVYLLHNPEYMVDLAVGGDPQRLPAARAYLYEKLVMAFVTLEQAVGQGLIGCYGVSSNGFAQQPDRNEFVSLADVREAAFEAASEVHGSGTKPALRVVQFPFNILETGAYNRGNTPCNGQIVPVLEAARNWGLFALTNRPLNALRNGQLLRLVEPTLRADRDPAETVKRHLSRLADAEVTLWRTTQTWQQRPRRPPTIASTIMRIWPELPGRDQWQQVYLGHVVPLVRGALQEMDSHCPVAARPEWGPPRSAYLDVIRDVDRAVTLACAYRDLSHVQPIRESLAALSDDAWRQTPLQEQALAAVASTPGIGCVLNGMRYDAYVDAVLRVMKRSAVEQPMLDSIFAASASAGA